MKTYFTFFILCLVFNSCFGYSMSNQGREFIKKHEGCKLVAYYDSNGYSIGYGHHDADITKGMEITAKQAEKYLDEDLAKAAKSVERLINALPYKYNFSQGFIDGFISFVYNTGEGGAKKSEFYSRLKKCRVSNGVMNKSDYNYTVAAIKTSRVFCDGHKKRRYEEHKMMMN